MSIMRRLMLYLAAAMLLARPLRAAPQLRVAIWVMHPDGTALRKVAQVPLCKEHSSPAWSHDGQRLAFNAIQMANGATKIFAVNVDGSGLADLGEGIMPDWSPDGKQIVFSHGGEIMVQNVDGKGRTVLTSGNAPRWSPDGSKIAFTAPRSLRVLDLVSGEERGRIDVPVRDVAPGCDWSPDGKRLAVVGRRDRERELFLITAEGPIELASRLTRNLDGRIAWSHDGKRIAFSSGRILSTLAPDGKGTQMIPDQRGVSVEPCWSPDDKWLAFSGNHPEAAK